MGVKYYESYRELNQLLVLLLLSNMGLRFLELLLLPKEFLEPYDMVLRPHLECLCIYPTSGLLLVTNGWREWRWLSQGAYR